MLKKFPGQKKKERVIDFWNSDFDKKKKNKTSHYFNKKGLPLLLIVKTV